VVLEMSDHKNRTISMLRHYKKGGIINRMEPVIDLVTYLTPLRGLWYSPNP
jgi:hypothetical protein